MDLRLGWDLGLEADQVKAQKKSSVEKPHLFILSPMCLAFSHLQTQNQTEWQNCQAGQTSLGVACSLAQPQVERGGRVLFEHLWAATSWNEPCLKELLAIDGMRRVRRDQCQFGWTSVDDAGNVGLARKATRFMTNDETEAVSVGMTTFSC